MRYSKKTKKRIYIPILLIAVLVVTIDLMRNIQQQRLIAKQRQSYTHNLKSSAEEEPVITGFQFTGYSFGNKIFTINAERLYLRNRKVKPFGFRIAFGKLAEIEEVCVTFYKDNKPVSRLNSNQATMDMKRKDIIFHGKPVLVTEDYKVLTAESFTWNNAQMRLEAKDKCSLGAEGKIRRATSIATDVEIKDFTISGEETG